MRSEPRKSIQVPVRIFGTDCDGHIFSEIVNTVDVSRLGVRVGGVRAHIKTDEIIGITYGRTTVHFRVKWVGQAGTTTAGQMALVNLSPERKLWDFPLPDPIIDNYRPQVTQERRRYSRVKCSISAELHPPGGPVTWGKASDLSEGGCFVEMSIPLRPGTLFEISIWLNAAKLRLQGAVASVSPGFGIGVRFINVPPGDQALLRQYIRALV
ncbi:MAG: PilZ domain-containing protein [Acidobacteria bacterium]|nr:PilZ domain-containing protein [Acidobacteriota bacterium]